MNKSWSAISHLLFRIFILCGLIYAVLVPVLAILLMIYPVGVLITSFSALILTIGISGAVLYFDYKARMGNVRMRGDNDADAD